jgi:hypothetical protein
MSISKLWMKGSAPEIVFYGSFLELVVLFLYLLFLRLLALLSLLCFLLEWIPLLIGVAHCALFCRNLVWQICLGRDQVRVMVFLAFLWVSCVFCCLVNLYPRLIQFSWRLFFFRLLTFQIVARNLLILKSFFSDCVLLINYQRCYFIVLFLLRVIITLMSFGLLENILICSDVALELQNSVQENLINYN